MNQGMMKVWLTFWITSTTIRNQKKQLFNHHQPPVFLRKKLDGMTISSSRLRLLSSSHQRPCAAMNALRVRSSVFWRIGCSHGGLRHITSKKGMCWYNCIYIYIYTKVFLRNSSQGSWNYILCLGMKQAANSWCFYMILPKKSCIVWLGVLSSPLTLQLDRLHFCSPWALWVFERNAVMFGMAGGRRLRLRSQVCRILSKKTPTYPWSIP